MNRFGRIFLSALAADQRFHLTHWFTTFDNR